MFKTRLFRVTLSITIAFGLWISVKLAQNYSSTIRIPVRFTNAPARVQYTTPFPTHLLVTAEAPGRELVTHRWFQFLRPDTIEVDLSTFTNQKSITPTQTLTVVREKFGGEMRATSVTPSEFNLNYVFRVSKRVPVVSKAKLTPEEGYYFTYSPRLKPDSVTLIGSPENLAKASFWETEEAEKTDIRGVGEMRLALKKKRRGHFRRKTSYAQL